MEHIKGICMVTNPIVNSYKRLVPGYEAAVYISWAEINRSALIRIPRYKTGKEKSTRIELRNPDTSANPYLIFSAMLAAGLDGVKNKTEPPEPVKEDVYEFDEEELKEHGIETLPASLGDAIKEYEKCEVAKQALGEHTYKKLLESKKAEWDDYRMQVHKWEIEKYLLL